MFGLSPRPGDGSHTAHDRWLTAVETSTESLTELSASLTGLQGAFKGAASAVGEFSEHVRSSVTAAP